MRSALTVTGLDSQPVILASKAEPLIPQLERFGLFSLAARPVRLLSIPFCQLHRPMRIASSQHQVVVGGRNGE
jgi:hypothetical protein